jgi:hypothetical protein
VSVDSCPVEGCDVLRVARGKVNVGQLRNGSRVAALSEGMEVVLGSVVNGLIVLVRAGVDEWSRRQSWYKYHVKVQKGNYSLPLGSCYGQRDH